MSDTVLLVNTNIAKPPVSPVGLEYVGEALVHNKLSIKVLDLSFESDWKAALQKEFKNTEFFAVGLSVRNTDDCSFISRKSFLPWIRDVVIEVKKLSQAVIILGGIGFSVMPEKVLDFTKADLGIAGDGEETLAALIRRLLKNEDIFDLPGLVYSHDGKVLCNLKSYVNLELLPLPHRGLFDNKKYQDLGAIVGIETKRGCPQQCIYCADPVAKGNRSRLRPASTIVKEFQNLVAQGITWFHLCDSEFNIPITHAKEVCRAIIEANLGGTLSWYTYCSPFPFDQELARLMKLAGCHGVNFGADSLCDSQLSNLGRGYSVCDIQRLVEILNKEKINYMFDLMIGGPGETNATVITTINEARRLNIPLIGISTGIRIYPETPLNKTLKNQSLDKTTALSKELNSPDPIFYLSPHLGSDPLGFIAGLVSGDPHFLVLSSPAEQANYNYADDEKLYNLIKNGARGAYWDILAKNR